MEFVPLSDTALRYLASDDPILKRFFYGVYPSDMLPDQPKRTTRAAYIVNTDNTGWPCGRKMERVKSLHYITYITYMDSYGRTGDRDLVGTMGCRTTERPYASSLEQSGLWSLCLVVFEKESPWPDVGIRGRMFT